jgi:two-component system phosphate regulon response regulator PhoB
MPKKILIVEDEKDPRRFLEILLQENGYYTLSAEDGIEAMENVKSHQPDVIILDILMPKETGIKFFRDLMKDKNHSKIPVIVCSGATQYKPLFKLDRPAFPKPFGFVEKPIDKNNLLAKIREAVES